MLGHFDALIPRQRPSQLDGQPVEYFDQALTQQIRGAPLPEADQDRETTGSLDKRGDR